MYKTKKSVKLKKQRNKSQSHHSNEDNRRQQYSCGSDAGKDVSARASSDKYSEISSSSSTLYSSSPQHSLDYEAEDEYEDKKKTNESASLLHVQNFLKCFGVQQRESTMPTVSLTNVSVASISNANIGNSSIPAAVPAAIPEPVTAVAITATTTTLTTLTNEAYNTVNNIHTTSSNEQCNWRSDNKKSKILINTAASAATTTSTTNALNILSTATTTSASMTSNKPGKFTISTKFLRKPRNKLKGLNLLASNVVKNNDETRSGKHPQLNNDDSNAKFKDFSIHTLLNK